MTGQMADERNACLARNWGWIAFRGGLGILLGVIVLLQPGLALFSLILLFAIYAIADGLAAIVSAVRAARRHERWGWFVLEGVVGLAAGAAALLLPGLAVISFVLLVSVWAVISGVSMLIAAFRLRGDHGRWWMVLAGAVSIAFGVLLFVQPVAGAYVLTIWIGAYAAAFGTMLIVAALRLRSRCRATGQEERAATA